MGLIGGGGGAGVALGVGHSVQLIRTAGVDAAGVILFHAGLDCLSPAPEELSDSVHAIDISADSFLSAFNISVYPFLSSQLHWIPLSLALRSLRSMRVANQRLVGS